MHLQGSLRVIKVMVLGYRLVLHLLLRLQAGYLLLEMHHRPLISLCHSRRTRNKVYRLTHRIVSY